MNVKTEELYYKTAAELSKMLDSGEITSVELTQAHIDRTKATDDQVKSYLSYDEEYTLNQAQESDNRRKEGKVLSALDGIPLSLKDNICDKGQPLTCASKILENYRSPYDATVTHKLKQAGAILWGRVNLDEFAMGSSTENSAYQATGNPWDPSRTPGGSSGGSAACVSAGQAVLSLGSDTGGSIRQPAAYCGIVGMKPTYGLVSRYGLAAFASSLDQIGPFARSVEDAAKVLEVIAGHDPFDSTSYKVDIPKYTETLKQERKYTLGIPKEYFGEGLSDSVRQAVEKAIDYYRSQGCEIREVSLPHTELAVPTYYVIASAEASSNLARYDGIRYTRRAEGAANAIDIFKKSRAEGFGDEVKRRIMLGTFVLSSGYYDAYYSRAQKVRSLMRKDFTDAFDAGVDAILTPTTPDTAFKQGEKADDPLAMYMEDIFTISTPLAGLPGISIPCGFADNGMPIGLQLIGNAYDEAKLLSVAHMYEAGNTAHNVHPKL